METLKMSLCPACSTCPEVEILGDEVRIGEAGNLAVLRKDEWNRRRRPARGHRPKRVGGPAGVLPPLWTEGRDAGRQGPREHLPCQRRTCVVTKRCGEPSYGSCY